MEAFAHRRRVTWSDTDTARIAYTVRILDYAMDAIEAWWEVTFGVTWYGMVVDRGTGGPWVHFDADISAPLTPEHEVSSSVFVEKVGTTSLSFRVEGVRSDGVPCYVAHLTTVFVDHDEWKPIPIPDDFLKPINEYRRAAGS
ncbi:MAG: acyl-CoA thioesterase [Acidimicrobiia bacterium]